ncbi:PMCA-type calcium-translocating P-type ATPase [Radiomyces spectabilis]|uniref:PMCA-type calcium-translocating P-type ATPase n=1 Tax=Radiomyces spectabilis TaxID=64574 RepID=UPI00221FEBFA|nr:PMCA-type calcium-translocating P-type ATPase [Radiomyces spectabilis]KAI8371591.1 PMCA-type calcium-translocating P-type ATPase [Radiomyces spectabilis]
MTLDHHEVHGYSPPPYTDYDADQGQDRFRHSVSSTNSPKQSFSPLQRPSPKQSSTINLTMLPHQDPSNPFAFTPHQLTALVDRKDLDFLAQIGGVEGVAQGLHSSLTQGISSQEANLPPITLHDLETAALDDVKAESYTFIDEKQPPVPGTDSATSLDIEPFLQRRRVFGSNILPTMEVKSIFYLMWLSFQDRTLILLTVSAIISLTVGIYEDVTTVEYDAAGNRIPGVKWVEGVAIIVAVLLVVVVGSVNDNQKEKQFRSLNAKKDDRHVSAIRSGQQCVISVHDIQVGDILSLTPGDIVAADGIFVQGYNLKCDESAATGESDAVKKIRWQDCMTLQWISEHRHDLASNEDSSSLVEASNDPEKRLHSVSDDFPNDNDSYSESHRPDPFLISGSKVLEGICTYLVTSVGVNSFNGRTLMALRTNDDTTPLQEKLDVLASSIAKLGLGAAGFLFVALLVRCIIGYMTASLSVLPADIVSQIMRILITTVTVVVVAVPEGLPLAVTLALAYATQRMLRDNNLVRILTACETMGNATTICSDKTGTLTQNKMSVVAGTFGSSFRFLRDPPAARTDLVELSQIRHKIPLPVRNFVNQAIAINSTAFRNKTSDGDVTLVGNKTEIAMLNFAKDALASEPFELLRTFWQVEQVFPFSSKRKAMGTVIRIPVLDQYTKRERIVYRVHIKGASEFLLSRSTRILSIHGESYDKFHGVEEGNIYDIETRTMTEANRGRMAKIIQSYATRCLRTLAVCYKDFDTWSSHHKLEDVLAAGGLTLLGIVGIEDPLRPGVKEAVAACQSAGVCVRMVTGDNMLTAKSIARQCGIYSYGALALDGPTFRQLPDAERLRILPHLRVLARSSPEDKRELVNALRATGEIVAVTGDGTNDGPALKAADVGFSMGVAGTEVAKEASSIILMDDNFSSIVRAISWGRCVNDSVKKFLQFQLTVNITAVMLTIVSAVASDEQKSILTAVQLLWVNLIMDTFAALALATDPPTPDLLERKPEPRTVPLIDCRMWKMILGQTFYQIGIILTLLYTNVLHLEHDEATLQTVVFTAFVFCQIFNEVNCRRIDNRFNVVKGIKKNHFFILIFVVSVCGQILIVECGGAAFQTVPLNSSHWMLSIAIGLMSIPIGAIIRMIPDEVFASPFFSSRK